MFSTVVYLFNGIVQDVTWRPQLRWCLCSQDDWRIEDGACNRQYFYWTIVSLFEGDSDENSSDKDDWVPDTLGWWTQQIFGRPTSKVQDEQGTELENSKPSDESERPRKRPSVGGQPQLYLVGLDEAHLHLDERYSRRFRPGSFIPRHLISKFLFSWQLSAAGAHCISARVHTTM